MKAITIVKNLTNNYSLNFYLFDFTNLAPTMRLHVSPKVHSVDEIALAKRLAIGDNMSRAAEFLGVTHPVIGRRVQAWRLEIAKELTDLDAVRYWRDRASPGHVARRWLFLQTRDPRWAPIDIEEY